MKFDELFIPVLKTWSSGPGYLQFRDDNGFFETYNLSLINPFGYLDESPLFAHQISPGSLQLVQDSDKNLLPSPKIFHIRPNQLKNQPHG